MGLRKPYGEVGFSASAIGIFIETGTRYEQPLTVSSGRELTEQGRMALQTSIVKIRRYFPHVKQGGLGLIQVVARTATWH